jgi:hypothetical protein
MGAAAVGAGGVETGEETGDALDGADFAGSTVPFGWVTLPLGFVTEPSEFRVPPAATAA